MELFAALTIGAFLVNAGSQLLSAKAQNDKAAQNKANANTAYGQTLEALSLQQTQVSDATSLTIMQADRQAREADAVARVSAGEAGVTGASVDALLGDLTAKASAFKRVQERNLSMSLAQIEREKAGARTQAINQINGVPTVNPVSTALSIAGSGLDLWSTLKLRQPGLSNG